jgi:pantoate--beta-alanine ligase
MPLELVETIAGLRQRMSEPRRAETSIGLVPTMGALHAGHASLMEHARRECGVVVVSIFVNPRQFNQPADLANYPRTLEADLDLCRSAGVDVVFAPAAAEMYPVEPICTVDVGRLAHHLCGKHRPGHFQGVATVVLKLFQIVQPGVAYFGEKDAQQLAVVRRLVADFNVPVRIVGVPTVREPDGLALSSRNRRLSADERRSATALFHALGEAGSRIAAGLTDVAAIKRHAAARIPADDRLTLEYLEVVDPDEFQPVQRVDAPVVVAGALWVGATRMIDNVHCSPPGSEARRPKDQS